MAEVKKTMRMYFEELKGYVEGNEELTNFLNRQIEKLDNKKSSGKSAKVIAEQEKVKADVLQILVDNGNPMTVGEMTKTEIAIAGNYSSSKITSYLTKLKDEKKVERFTEKKIAYYKLVD